MIEKPTGIRMCDYETDEALSYLTYLYRDLGATDELVAKNIGISRKTLYNWKRKSSKIDSAITLGKALMDIKVENSLLKQALSGNVVAQTFWLKNRKPDKWRDFPKNEKEDNFSNKEMELKLKILERKLDSINPQENLLSDYFDKLEEIIDE